MLVGLDDDMAALVVRVDPYLLSPLGEVAALRDHRPTYRLQHGVLERRDRWTIPGHLPSHHVHVLAEHRCGQHPPDDWLLGPGPRPATRPAPATEGMPY